LFKLDDMLIVIKEGEQLHNTIACINYDKFGQNLYLNTFVCTTWEQGFQYAKKHHRQVVLFVDSGTVVLDWTQLVHALNRYPFKGMLAHLVYDKAQNQLRANDQAFLVDITQFPDDLENYCPDMVNNFKVSDKNIHSNYTPLWASPMADSKHPAYCVDQFLQKMLFYQLNENNKPVFNWHQNLRDNKIYLYNTDQVELYKHKWECYRSEYSSIAENQLWILNNEETPWQKARGTLLAPGSGLFWIMSLLNPKVHSISIADISVNQVKYVEHLLNNWTGRDLGQAVVEFLRENKIQHFQIDKANISKQEKIMFMNKKYLADYINKFLENFLQQHSIKDFETQWNANKHKVREIANISLLEMNLSEYDTVWTSNIFN